MYFEIYRETAVGIGLINSTTAGQWRWRLRAANNETIASGESYHNKQDCLHAIDLVKSTNKDTPVKETRE
jgi:uncharacterized protein YegP (UPF0339 family)